MEREDRPMLAGVKAAMGLEPSVPTPPESGQQAEPETGVQEQTGAESAPDETPPTGEAAGEPGAPAVAPKPRHGDVRGESGQQEMYVKVEGVGQWIPLSEVADGFSYNSRNDRVAKRLKAEREELKALEASILAKMQQLDSSVKSTPTTESEFDSFFSTLEDAPGAETTGAVVKPLLQEIRSLKDELQEIKGTVRATTAEAKLARDLAAFSDPESGRYIPGFDRSKVEALLLRMPEDEAVMWRRRGADGYELLFRRMKDAEAARGGRPTRKGAPAPPPPAQETVAGPSSSARSPKPTAEDLSSEEALAAYIAKRMARKT